MLLSVFNQKVYCAEGEIDCDNLPIPEPPLDTRIVYPYLPEELKRLADKVGCEHKFEMNIYEECLFKETPFYAYGYLPGKKEDSAAFWCTKDTGYKKQYMLVIYHKNKKPKNYRCSDIIYGKNYPNPLSIFKATGESLEYFKNIENPKKVLPKDAKLTNNGILSSIETSELFYCYKGKWIVRVGH
jgi:hypothetical protein